MIIAKDSVTRETLVKLLDYSLREECYFLVCIKPNTDIALFKKGSVIKFLKIEEKVTEYIVDLEKHYCNLFHIKVLVEDKYWEKIDGKYHHTGHVPSKIHNEVSKIIN